jgi:flavodoxin
MKVGIILYSNTGNTYLVSLKLQEKLSAIGIKSDIDRIEVKRDIKKDPNKIEFIYSPDINKYDIVVIASPVEAFSLCPVMRDYLNSLGESKKLVFCFVTEELPYAWMGGNNAIKKMREICSSKKMNIVDTGVINWRNKKRDQMIENMTSKFTNKIKEII